MENQKMSSSGSRFRFFAVFVFFMFSFFQIIPSSRASAQEIPEVPADPSQRLSQALHHYYNEEYGQALPIFEAIAADKGENEDLLFWMGVCAYKTGDFQTAITRFETILSRQPDLARVRLELAMANFRMGRYDLAKAEILRAKEFPAPDDIRQEMDATLRLIESYENRISWGANLSTGYRYDSNATAGPDVDVVDDTLYVMPLPDDSQEQPDSIWLTDFKGTLRNDVYGPRGLLLNAALRLMDRRYFEYTDLNYTEFDCSFGPVWDRHKMKFSLPVGYTQKLFGGDTLSGVAHVDAAVERDVTDRVSLQGNIRVSRENFSDDDFSDAGLDNSRLGLWVGGSWRPRNHPQKLSVNMGGENRSADADHQCYDSFAVNLSYFVRLMTDTDLYLMYSLTEYEYDEPAPWYSSAREDTRHSASIALARKIYRNVMGTLKYAYLNNDSNNDLYAFDKHTVSLQLGLRF